MRAMRFDIYFKCCANRRQQTIKYVQKSIFSLRISTSGTFLGQRGPENIEIKQSVSDRINGTDVKNTFFAESKLNKFKSKFFYKRCPEKVQRETVAHPQMQGG